MLLTPLNSRRNPNESQRSFRKTEMRMRKVLATPGARFANTGLNPPQKTATSSAECFDAGGDALAVHARRCATQKFRRARIS